ncbi:hypothetical protein VTN00DRAFT_3178 [Thermoascus crustaceus]
MALRGIRGQTRRLSGRQQRPSGEGLATEPWIPRGHIGPSQAGNRIQ